jgi:hypothetical protein
MLGESSPERLFRRMGLVAVVSGVTVEVSGVESVRRLGDCVWTERRDFLSLIVGLVIGSSTQEALALIIISYLISSYNKTEPSGYSRARMLFILVDA